jgi:membrane peptidoglycan carboxypeptidase
MKLLLRNRLRKIFIFLAIVLTIQSAAFTGAFFTAVRYLHEHDPRKSGDVAGTLIFARPKLLRVGQQISIQDVVEHLSDIGYQMRPGDDSGTFTVSRNTVHVHSRLSEFPSAEIRVEQQKISSISVNGQSVEQVEIEPQQLVSFIRLVRDDIARQMRVRRTVLQSTDIIPSVLYDAIRSSEDHNFESHNGISELGMLRGIFSGGGGSTITQQMIKNVVLADQSKSYNRKVKEAMLALAAERMMSKAEIMTAYANNCYLGHVVGGPTLFGFAAAAQEFFGVSNIKALSLGQSATLAGMLDKPETYLNAARNGDYALLLARRERVLALMQKNFPERYPPELIATAKTETLKFVFTSEQEKYRTMDMISKHFLDFAAARIQQALPQSNDKSNLHIYTTIDPDMQSAAYKSVLDQLNKLDPVIVNLLHKSPPKLQNNQRIQAALVAMDAQTGEVLAMVGGRDGEFNHATAPRSPGSAIKPFIYLKAIEKGMHHGTPFTAATILDPKNDPVDNYRPEEHIGAPGRARTLLARSDNGGAVVAGHDAGLSEVREFIHSLTGSNPIELTGMMAIGGSAGCEVDPLSLTSAYTIFPNNGIKVTATPFAAVYNNGSNLPLTRNSPTRVINAESAFILTQMMRSVLQPGGTAEHALSLAGLSGNDQLAGKTGTGQVSDFWFVGFSRRLIVTVWVGMDDNTPLPIAKGFDGARVAMPIWASFMKSVKHYKPELLKQEFQRPTSVKILRIHPQQGCVVETGGIEEFFISGREPIPCGKN